MKAKQNFLQNATRIVAVIAGIALFAALFVPIWQIQLTAPQYPEGLELYIYADKLDGDVQIINGLNHYIGMRELHEQDFVEFAILPYVIGALGLMGLVVALVNRRRLFFIWVTIYGLFGVLAIIDFYKWLYDYGHNLDPAAPIQVPGMTYQPPLIGFKQLLNFGAYSIPEKGGWLMVGAAVLLIVMFFVELKQEKKEA